MELLWYVFVLFAICITLLIIILCMHYFMPQMDIDHLQNPVTDEPVHKFQTNLQFQEFPEDKVIENPFICNAHTLVKCTIDEPIVGCSQLSVTCQHFKEDTVFYENQEPVLIPKNEKPDEGYALSIPITSKSCNLYHGDLILVAMDDMSNDYMLLCHCKKSGFIGNDSVLGNCTAVHICGGKVKDINKPLSELECVCEKTEMSQTIQYDEFTKVPICKVMTVQEANEKYTSEVKNGKWTELIDFKGRNPISISNFDPTIRSNLHVTQLPNPCEIDILSGEKIPFPLVHFHESSDANIHTCQSSDSGIPVRTNILRNDVKDTKVFQPIDGFISSETYDFIRYTDHVDGHRHLAVLAVVPKTQIHTDANKKLYIKLPEPISLLTQIKQNTEKTLYVIKCQRMLAFTYVCYYEDGYATETNGIPRSKYEEVGSLIYNYAGWLESEKMESEGLKVSDTGIDIDFNIFGARKDLRAYGMIYLNKNSKTYAGNGIAWMNNESDFQKHKNSITNEPEKIDNKTDETDESKDPINTESHAK